MRKLFSLRPFSSGNKKEMDNYVDVTDHIVQNLIDKEILEDQGFLYKDSDEPDTVYIRKIVNVWQR